VTWEEVRPGLGLEALRGYAARLATHLEAGRDPEEALTVGLVGDLGAGKTTFAQAFVAALPGGEGVRVTSPTYAIVHTHPTRPPVRHIDLYRVGGVDELEAIGYGELVEAPGVNVVEWIRAIPEAIPDEWLEIELAAGADPVRDIRARAHGARMASLLRRKVTHR
jgi:tRNA threonylcarbamoyl adenosine modification protein YjeE